MGDAWGVYGTAADKTTGMGSACTDANPAQVADSSTDKCSNAIKEAVGTASTTLAVGFWKIDAGFGFKKENNGSPFNGVAI